MIKSKLPYVMLDHKIKSVTELSRQTTISRETLTKLYNQNKVDTVSLGMIFKLYDFFNCTIGDLIEYIPEKQLTETITK